MTDNTNAKMLAMQKEHGPLLEVRNLAIDFTTVEVWVAFMAQTLRPAWR